VGGSLRGARAPAALVGKENRRARNRDRDGRFPSGCELATHRLHGNGNTFASVGIATCAS
jgi:hypothetical protein